MDGSDEVDCPPPDDGDAPTGDALATTTTQPVVDKSTSLPKEAQEKFVISGRGVCRRPVKKNYNLVQKSNTPLEIANRNTDASVTFSGNFPPPAKLYNKKSSCTLQTVEGKWIYFYK